MEKIRGIGKEYKIGDERMKRVFIWLFCLLVLLSPVTAAAEREEEVLRLPVVMYHHISKRSAAWNNYVISPEEFAADLDYLAAKGYETVSVRQLLDWYEGKFDMPEKPCMITFDDGFESTMAYAEPMLEERGFTAVAAVIGAVCEQFSACDEHDPELSNLSWEDAVGLAKRGVIEIQCHTWNMHCLSPRNGCCKIRWESEEEYRVALERDLGLFLQECEKQGLDIVPTIAYPYGAFCGETTEIVKELGFRAAFTCDELVNVLTGNPQELFRLARFNRPHGVSSEKFFSKWEEKP